MVLKEELVEFLDWLKEKDIILAEESNDSESDQTYHPSWKEHEELAKEFLFEKKNKSDKLKDSIRKETW